MRIAGMMGFLAWISGLCCSSCGWCSKATSDEEQIRSLVQRAAELAEKHDLGGLMELTTDDFSVQPKGWSRRDTKRTLFFAFRRFREFSLWHPSPGVQVDPTGNQATAKVAFLLVRKGKAIPNLDDFKHDPKTWLQKAGDLTNLFRIQLGLIKQDDDWLVQQARLERFKGLGFGP